jgi:hypothetical protein
MKGYSQIQLISLFVIITLICGCTNYETDSSTGNGSQFTNNITKMTFESSPAGAEVYFDEIYWGTTPTTVDSVSLGSHVVEFRLNGYKSVKSDINLTSLEDTYTVSVVLNEIDPTSPHLPKITYSLVNETVVIPQDQYKTWKLDLKKGDRILTKIETDGANIGFEILDQKNYDLCVSKTNNWRAWGPEYPFTETEYSYIIPDNGEYYFMFDNTIRQLYGNYAGRDVKVSVGIFKIEYQ